jgi:hypothetical protein
LALAVTLNFAALAWAQEFFSDQLDLSDVFIKIHVYRVGRIKTKKNF